MFKFFLSKIILFLIDLLFDFKISLCIFPFFVMVWFNSEHRENLLDKKKEEVGGLSGRPLKDLSTQFIKKFYKNLKGEIPIIGVGGIDSGESAFEKISICSSISYN